MAVPDGALRVVVRRIRDRMGDHLSRALFCRILLGFFEAGQWPWRLVTAQRLLSRRDRPLGNSILQSGASFGAIATPFVVISLTTTAPDSWRLPFRVIGAAGAVWVIAWLAIVRARDLM